jgi:NAD(P)H-hydrate epimerase
MSVSIGVGPDDLVDASDSAVVVDALIGYGLRGRPRDPAETLIDLLNQRDGSIVSLDVPSGVDATTGETPGAAVVPDRTVTLALPKIGLADRTSPLYLADISVPHTVYDRLDIEYENPFGRNAWVELEQLPTVTR